jgi:hypothetical protein
MHPQDDRQAGGRTLHGPSQHLRPRGARLHALLRAALAAGLAAGLAGALAGVLLGACASTGSEESLADEPIIDYPARHQRMLDVVLLQPLQLQMQLEEEQRMRHQRSEAAWEAVEARQRAFIHYQRQLHRRDPEQFQRMLALQRQYASAHEASHAEAWAQFLEKRPPAAAAPSGTSSGAAPANPPAGP